MTRKEEAIKHLRDVICFSRLGNNSTEIINDFTDDEVEMIKEVFSLPEHKDICIGCGKEYVKKSPTQLMCAGCMKEVTEDIKIDVKGFKKADNGKAKWHMLPFKQVEQVLRIIEFGAQKYGPNNWQTCTEPDRYIDAAFRHLISYASGDKLDSESGKSHLAHCACNLLFLMWMDDNKVDSECKK